FPSLAPGERLAVLALNAGGREGAVISVSASGLSDPASEPLAAPLSVPTPSPALVAAHPVIAADVHAALRQHQDESLRDALSVGIAPASVAGPPLARTSFCIARGLDFGNRTRKDVTLV